MPNPAILFDLDGTLINTLPDLLTATNGVLAEFGRPPVDAAMLATFIGHGPGQLISAALPSSDEARREHIWQRFVAHYAACNGDDSVPFPGVVETLDALRERGTRMAVVTNKREAFTLPLLERLNLTRYFGAIVSADTCERCKPDPMPVHHALDLIGATVRDALFVGDSITDVNTAKGLDMPVYVVSYGYHGELSPQTMGATAVIDSMTRVLDWQP